jgi:hypothetical protein
VIAHIGGNWENGSLVTDRRESGGVRCGDGTTEAGRRDGSLLNRKLSGNYVATILRFHRGTADCYSVAGSNRQLIDSGMAGCGFAAVPVCFWSCAALVQL